MGLITGPIRLTTINPELEAARLRTWPGQAHFAGSGPSGETCRTCASWGEGSYDPGYYSRNGKHGGVLKPRPCGRYMAMMSGDAGPAVPHDAAACKYFEAAEQVRPVRDKR